MIRAMRLLKQSLLLVCLVSFTALTGCVVKQTTTRDGAFVEEKYVIKRPVKNFVENVEVE